MECGIAADYLQLSVDDLGDLLIELKERGLIALSRQKVFGSSTKQGLKHSPRGKPAPAKANVSPATAIFAKSEERSPVKRARHELKFAVGERIPHFRFR